MEGERSGAAYQEGCLNRSGRTVVREEAKLASRSSTAASIQYRRDLWW
jgi:hypothetical protein